MPGSAPATYSDATSISPPSFARLRPGSFSARIRMNVPSSPSGHTGGASVHPHAGDTEDNEMSTNKCKQPLSTEEMESKAEELNRLVDSLEKGREEHRALMAEMEAREKQEPLSLQFVNAVKQLCKDFSDRQGRPYMTDVYNALDWLLVNEGIPVAPDQQAELAQEESASLRSALEQAYLALIGYLPALRNDVTDAAIDAARAALGHTEEPFPSHKRQSKPCGECHLQDGERCDICGALQRTQP